MKYAIIAAGEGSRLAQEGLQMPKPLVRVGEERLIDRLIRIFMEHDASGIYVICNDLTPYVQAHLADLQANGLNGRQVPLQYVVKSTPSSMHSFYELRHFLGDEPFCLTTVDTIFRESDFSRYIAVMRTTLASGQTDGLMGVTDFIDDEKPLYIDVDENDIIQGFFDEKGSCRLISGGIYGLTPQAIPTLERCVENGESRMRNFQRALVADGLRLKSFRFSKVLDIDHVSDIAKAEVFLQSGVE